MSPAPPTPADHLAASESAMAAERPADARAQLDALGDPSHLAPDLRDRARYLRLRSDAALGVAADRLVLAARAALADTRDPRWCALLHREAARHLARKRCASLARAAARASAAAFPECAVGHDALAVVHLALDARDEARATYAAAVALSDAWRAHLGLARVHYLDGELDLALEALDRVPDAEATRALVLRQRIAVAHARGDHARRLAHLDALLARTPGGFRRRADLLDRASALRALDRTPEALEVYRAVLRERDDDPHGRFAREVLDAARAAPRVALATVPAVVQKRGQCGPAVLAMVLGALGLDASQDAIAAEVKRGAGSSMWALARHLEARGLATREFEGTPDRLRACLARGLPVVVREEHVASHHVSVVTGLDDALGLVLVQDPAARAPGERTRPEHARLGALFRGAALVAFPRDDAALAAALDAHDVRDEAHLRLVDECEDDAVRAQPGEVERRCAAALARREDFPLARRRLALEHQRLAAERPSPEAAARALASLREARVRHPDAAWSHRLHADHLLAAGRWEEALIELAALLALAPRDADAHARAAACHRALGRDADAARALWDALAVDPAHAGATGDLAARALATGDAALASHLAACGAEMAPERASNHLVLAETLAARGALDAAVAQLAEGIARARETPTALARRAVGLLLGAGRADDALALAHRVARERPAEMTYVVLLDALSSLDRGDEARAVARAMHSRWPSSPIACTELAARLLGTDAQAEGEQLLRRALEIAPDYPRARALLGPEIPRDRDPQRGS